jgi:hypothetical protein
MEYIDKAALLAELKRRTAIAEKIYQDAPAGSAMRDSNRKYWAGMKIVEKWVEQFPTVEVTNEHL